jgi:hypothetical protein
MQGKEATDVFKAANPEQFQSLMQHISNREEEGKFQGPC